MSVLSLEWYSYHMRRVLIKDAKSFKRVNLLATQKNKKIYACMYAPSLFSHSNRTIYCIYLKEMNHSLVKPIYLPVL